MKSYKIIKKHDSYFAYQLPVIKGEKYLILLTKDELERFEVMKSDLSMEDLEYIRMHTDGKTPIYKLK